MRLTRGAVARPIMELRVAARASALIAGDKLLLVMPVPLSVSVHWTAYVQTFAAIASTIGTFVYVIFTYHIMKWAVGQGKASIEVAALTVRQQHERDALVRSETLHFLSHCFSLKSKWERVQANDSKDMLEVEKSLDHIFDEGERIVRLNTSHIVRDDLRTVLSDLTAVRSYSRMAPAQTPELAKRRQRKFNAVLDQLFEDLARAQETAAPFVLNDLRPVEPASNS